MSRTDCSGLYLLFTADALGVFTLLDKLIVAFGMGLMLVGLLCMALFIPVFLAFVVYAVLYPLIQLVVQLRGGGLSGTLAVILTLIHFVLLLLLAALAPLIYSFQSLRIDIIDIKNFPGLFYEKHTIQELHKRYSCIERYHHGAVTVNLCTCLGL